MLEIFGTACALLLFLCIIYLIFAAVGDMARARGHSPWPWWFISLAWSPFGSMFVLWMFFDLQGKDDEQEDEVATK